MVNQYDYMLGNLLNKLEQGDTKQRWAWEKNK